MDDKTLTKQFINDFVYHQNDSIIKEIFLANCIVYNSFGIAVGPEMYTRKSKFWGECFKPLSLTFTDSIINEHSVTYGLTVEMEHKKIFKDVKPLGQKAKLDFTILTQSHNKKIAKMHVVSNFECVLNKLRKEAGQKPHKTTLSDNTNLYNDCYSSTLNHINSLDINLTEKGLYCLFLWFSGYPDNKIAEAVGISRRTAHYHQDRLKFAFKCETKIELFDKIRELQIDHLLIECFMLFVLEKSKVA